MGTVFRELGDKAAEPRDVFRLRSAELLRASYFASTAASCRLSMCT
jgi:hypothetical protein